MADRPYVQIANKHLQELKSLLLYLKVKHSEASFSESLQKGLDLVEATARSIDRDNHEA